MQLTQNRNTGEYSIKNYTPGEIRINETCYTHSLLLSPHQIVENWPPENIFMLTSEHLNTIIQLNPEIVLLGTGEHQHFPDPFLFSELMSKHIGYEIMDTLTACYTFNLLAQEGRKVVAGLIIR